MQSWNTVSFVLRGCLHKPSCPFFRRLPMLRMDVCQGSPTGILRSPSFVRLAQAL